MSEPAGPPDEVTFVAALVEAHGLGPVAALSQFKSFGNENWLVEVADGRQVVLRRYVHSSLERVRFQRRLQSHLQAHSFPVSQIFPMPSGQPYTLDEAGTAWAAFSYVEGDEYDFDSLAHAEEAGRVLAWFHRLGDGLEGDVPGLVHRPSILECWSGADRDLDGLAELFRSAPVQDELAYLREWWHLARREWPLERMQALPFGLVHGDYHGRNLAFRDGAIAGVFDFDDVERGPLVHDLAMSVFKFARESRCSLELRPAFASHFVQGYERVRSLTPEERLALPWMLSTNYPPNPRYYRYYREHYGTNIEARLRREAGTMRTLREQAFGLFERE